jgi:glycosyltransferase involved in cell wall biosynthesis
MLIANSDFTARRIETLFGIRPPVMPPVIEPERYRVDPPGDSVLLVNPSLRKGVELFFRLAAARPDIPFLAVESWTVYDTWRTVLMNRARALDNVALWPPVEDMREAYARARLVLMPSIHEETFGRVVAEAQVSGIPALVSDRGALPETLAGGGVVVPVDAGIDAWSAALDRLWSDADAYRAASDAALAASTRPERRPERIAEDFLDRLRRF